MPGHHGSNCCSRHHRLNRSDQVDPIPARMFWCPRCRELVVICSRCDRGQIYCVGDCARSARREAQRAAGRRYQLSRQGRLLHAERARRYRARRNNVTHQGSLPAPARDPLPAELANMASETALPNEEPREPKRRCHWCQCRCPQLLRQGFLHSHGLRRAVARR
jgi:hypothetical protein